MSNLHRKSKFGLPGITPMPTSSKVTTSPNEELNGVRQQREPLQSFGLSRGVSCPEILPKTSPSDSAVSQISEYPTSNVSKKSKFGLCRTVVLQVLDHGITISLSYVSYYYAVISYN